MGRKKEELCKQSRTATEDGRRSHHVNCVTSTVTLVTEVDSFIDSLKGVKQDKSVDTGDFDCHTCSAKKIMFQRLAI